MSLIKEFKEFAMKGSVIDLAVGVVIGGAFQSIVDSLVNDIIMPFTGLLTGSVNYQDWTIELFNGAAQIQIGSFITALINFLIIAFSIFIALKYINKLNKTIEDINKTAAKKIKKKNRKKEEKTIKIEEPIKKTCPYCLSEIPYKAIRCSYCTSELETDKE